MFDVFSNSKNGWNSEGFLCVNLCSTWYIICGLFPEKKKKIVDKRWFQHPFKTLKKCQKALVLMMKARSKRLRLYRHNARTWFNMCADDVVTHGDVLNVHTKTCLVDTLDFQCVTRTTSHHTETETETETDRDRQRQTETEKEDRNRERREDGRGETRQHKREEREKIHFNSVVVHDPFLLE